MASISHLVEEYVIHSSFLCEELKRFADGNKWKKEKKKKRKKEKKKKKKFTLLFSCQMLFTPYKFISIGRNLFSKQASNYDLL